MTINASAYAHNGHICVMGVYPTEFGPIPFNHTCAVDGIADGPVNLNGELAPEVGRALDESQQVIMATIGAESVKQGAKELVERARQRDQNAMAMIVMVRESAHAGSQRAKQAFRALMQYIKTNPIGKSSFGFDAATEHSAERVADALEAAIDESDPLHYSTALVALVPSIGMESAERAAVILSNGPALFGADDSNPRITAVKGAFCSPREQQAFVYGFRNSNSVAQIMAAGSGMSPAEGRALQVGYTLGYARAIQAVRQPNIPIAVLCSNTAWELGE